MTTSFRTTEIRKEWAEHGEMTIRTTFRRRIGGVTKRKDQKGWSDFRTLSQVFSISCVSSWLRTACYSFKSMVELSPPTPAVSLFTSLGYERLLMPNNTVASQFSNVLVVNLSLLIS